MVGEHHQEVLPPLPTYWITKVMYIEDGRRVAWFSGALDGHNVSSGLIVQLRAFTKLP
jgi:hypothetical protein